MGEVLKKFGRYFLLDDIAQGGMAEIFRARLASADGAGRLMVIKRIQAGYGANTEFQQMFKSEIKVTMGFNHPNIVQLYDFGEEQTQPYIAMELVDGKNLRQFITRANELKQPFPVELAAFIMEQAASGLHYAHSYRDKITGEAYNIVHRDISPQNILISYEGTVKVIDFGIAKATTNMEATRAGVIKGKPSYLSPEQISGEVLDGRSDIFALGAVLWECLTGKKLFAGESDLAVLKLIESCQTYVKPPSTLNPKVPKELDYLVLKTLAKQREKRFQNAEELQRAFHKFLYAFAPDFNPSDLSYYAKDLFKNEIVEDRKKIQKLNEKAEVLLASGIQDSPAAGSNADDRTVLASGAKKPVAGSGEHLFENSAPNVKIETEPTAYTQVRNSSSPRTMPSVPTPSTPAQPMRQSQTSMRSSAPIQRKTLTPSEPTSNAKYIGIGVAALLVVSIFGPDFGIRIPILSSLFSDILRGNEARLILEGNQKNVVVAINGETVANSLPATLRGSVGTPFRVTVTGAAGSFQQDITLKKGEQKSVMVTLSTDGRVPTSSMSGVTIPEKGVLLKLSITPGASETSKMKVQINGRDVSPVAPSLTVPLDTPLEISIDRDGYKPFHRSLVLDSRTVGSLKEWSADISLEPTRFGFITIHTVPSAEATMMIDGSQWQQKTPVENWKIPAGTYSLHLTNQVLGMEKTVNITIEENKAITVDERLQIK
ncbi:MAG: serine/threonine protein kinase [Bdellovibrio sp.]|nr:serine/threonine protein kinase [Bdellovibrio sp.]